MSADPTRLEVRDRVATLTIDRPHAMNAISEEVLSGIGAALDAVEADPSVKALVITGAGETFCIGLDIDLLGRAFADTAYFRSVLERFRDLMLRIEGLPVPVVAAVNGLARAGGFEIILASDLVIVAEEARVADHHLSFGIIPGGGASQRIERALGRQRGREVMFTARWLTGVEAAEAGLALRAVPHAELDAAVEALVSQLRGLSRPALGAAKRVMNDGARLPPAQALTLEIDRFIEFLDREPTSREGYRAYIEGRAPVWD